jgi:hypothetical protein
LTVIHSIIQKLAPQSLIDLGVGHGKTGVLTREYLDIMRGNYSPDTWKARIYGIEVFEDYRNPLWDYVYDSVVIADALDGLKQLPDVDLIVALDIWEHFEPDYAQQVLETCLEKAQYLLISTPKNPREQGSVFGNVAETHVSRWEPVDFAQVPHLMVSSTAQDWILLLSRKSIPESVRVFGSPKARISEALRVAIPLWKVRQCNR